MGARKKREREEITCEVGVSIATSCCGKGMGRVTKRRRSRGMEKRGEERRIKVGVEQMGSMTVGYCNQSSSVVINCH